MGTRIYRVNSKEFECLVSERRSSDIDAQILKWLKDNVHSYQMYTIDVRYSENGCYEIKEVIVYEEF